MEYVRRLNEVGVSVELHVYPGCIHAFDLIPTEIAKRSRAALLSGLRSAFQ